MCAAALITVKVFHFGLHLVTGLVARIYRDKHLLGK